MRVVGMVILVVALMGVAPWWVVFLGTLVGLAMLDEANEKENEE